MKVLRVLSKILLVLFCAVAGFGLADRLLDMGSGWPLAPMSSVSAAGAQNAPQACPAAEISGTIGSGSPDHPFVTGNQTSRLFRNSIESTCGTAKPTPNLTDVGTQFKFDAFSFTNTSASTVCITVITKPAANNQLFAAAYLGSYNPNNVQANYLGDAGDSDGTKAFSFLVPANQNFVVVQSRVNNAANPPSLSYTFRVLGIPTCNSCPPALISGTIGTGSSQYPAASDIQTGRLFRDAVASACNPAKTVPSVTDGATQFAYDAYTFLNTSASAACVTVNLTAFAPNQVLGAAYLDRYNPNNVQENYLGDAGNSDQTRSFSFTVPAKRSFVVVISRVNNAGNPPSLSYFFSINGLTGCTGCPVINISPDTLPNGRLGDPYSQQLTRTGGAASGTWSVIGSLPSNLTLNSSTGLLSGTPTVSGNFSFSARFTDSNGCQGQQVFSFQVVTCPTITLNPDSLPSAALNQNYNQQLTTTGGTAPITFSLLAGAPPTGITLSSSGLLSGAPTNTTATNFTVRATDTFGCTGTKTYTVIVCGQVAVNPATAQNGFVNTPYSQTFTQTGGAGTQTWSSTGTLPNGLSLNSSTGVLSGTPTTTGTFNFTIRATSFNGCFGERAYSVTISNCPTITLSPNLLPAGRLNLPYSQVLTASGGTAPYTFNLSGGALPTGLGLATNGTLAGVPTQLGTFNVTIKATSTGGCFGTQSYTLVIKRALLKSDFDGDGKSDLVVWRGAEGNWFVLRSSDNTFAITAWGLSTSPFNDIPVVGDYDGDGKADHAVWRPGTGQWLIRRSSDQQFQITVFGLGVAPVNDIPVPEDYDGDGKTDIAIWRPAEGKWFILRSSNGQSQVTAWGTGVAPFNDVPLPGDYDGDGKADLAVFRRSDGNWLILRSSDNGFTIRAQGIGTDIPVPCDYDGDGKVDIATWRGTDGNWSILRSSTDTVQVTTFGTSSAPFNDQPVPGDFDGDGKVDIAIWRRQTGTWFVLKSTGGNLITAWGGANDTPISQLR